MLVYLIVHFWHASAVYQTTLVILKFGQVTMISEPYQVSDLISQDIRTVDMAPDWIIANLGTTRQRKQGLCQIFSTLSFTLFAYSGSNEQSLYSPEDKQLA